MGFIAFVTSLLTGASAFKAIMTYSAFGAFAVVLLAIALLCADTLEERSQR
ncbi:hypothetical protein R5H30_11545 [Sulfitobacter sp. D35]|nr:hypothetical protein [Sulfitobacter sp. D35]